MEVKQVKIARYSRDSSVAGPIVGIALVLLIGLRAVFEWRAHRQIDASHICFIVAYFVGVVFMVYLQLVVAREITVHANDQIEFAGWARRVRIHARDIRSIRWFLGYKSVRSNFLLVRHNSGTLPLADEIKGMDHFLTDLKGSNPSVQVA